MRLRRCTRFIPAILSVLLGTATPVSAENSMMVAAPQEGHPGDTIYLSADGLAPHRRVGILMACPNWYDQSVWQDRNYRFVKAGPTTDDHGSFRAYPFQVLALHGLKSMPLCQIYVQDGTRTFGPDFPAAFSVLAPGVQPKPMWRRPTVHVSTSPLRVHSGLFESVTVRSWPGAVADVTVSYPGASAMHAHIDLNLTGMAKSRFLVGPTESSQDIQAQVQVKLHIGTRSGRGAGHFTIVRG